jgi:transposase
MGRAALLQEIRKMRFLEVYERCRKRRLSYAEAAETLGVSERTFRRLRDRFEVEGEDGLLDRRLGKPSPHRIGAAEVARVVALYRERYLGWTVKHFHERAQQRHGLLREAQATDRTEPAAAPLRQGNRSGSTLSRRHDRAVLWATLHRPVRSRWHADEHDQQGRVTRFHATALGRGMPRPKARMKRTTYLSRKPDKLTC